MAKRYSGKKSEAEDGDLELRISRLEDSVDHVIENLNQLVEGLRVSQCSCIPPTCGMPLFEPAKGKRRSGKRSKS
jgi:hypothetical protein